MSVQTIIQIMQVDQNMARAKDHLTRKLFWNFNLPLGHARCLLT